MTEQFDLDRYGRAQLEARRGEKWARDGSAAIPMWVADMDFPLAPPIRRVLEEAIATGDLGYPVSSLEPTLAAAFADWERSRHGLSFDPVSVVVTTDVVQAIYFAIDAVERPRRGDPHPHAGLPSVFRRAGREVAHARRPRPRDRRRRLPLRRRRPTGARRDRQAASHAAVQPAQPDGEGVHPRRAFRAGLDRHRRRSRGDLGRDPLRPRLPRFDPHPDRDARRRDRPAHDHAFLGEQGVQPRGPALRGRGLRDGRSRRPAAR